MKIISGIKRILSIFLKISAILSLAILFILRPDLILPFFKMIAVAGAFIWFLKFIKYDPNCVVEPPYHFEEDEEKSFLWDIYKNDPIPQAQIYHDGYLKK